MYDKITAWRGGVHATLLLPSPAPAEQEQETGEITTTTYAFPPTYYLRQNRMPPEVLTDLLTQLSASILGQLGTTQILTILPKTKSSVRSVL